MQSYNEHEKFKGYWKKRFQCSPECTCFVFNWRRMAKKDSSSFTVCLQWLWTLQAGKFIIYTEPGYTSRKVAICFLSTSCVAWSCILLLFAGNWAPSTSFCGEPILKLKQITPIV